MGTLWDLTQKLAGLDPTTSLVFTVLGIVIASFSMLSRGWFTWHERSFGIDEKRQKQLLEVMKNARVATTPPLLLELAFRRGMGFELPSQELRFALQRENSLRLLRALRRGRGLVSRDAAVYVRKTATPLWVLDVLGSLVGSIAGLLGCGAAAYAWQANAPAWYAIALELAVLVWMCTLGMRSAAAARFLVDAGNYPAAPPAVPETPPSRPGKKDPRAKTKGKRERSKPSEDLPPIQRDDGLPETPRTTAA